MRYARRRRGGPPPASPVGFVTVAEDDGGRDDGGVFVAVNSASLWGHPFARAGGRSPGGPRAVLAIISATGSLFPVFLPRRSVVPFYACLGATARPFAVRLPSVRPTCCVSPRET